MIQVAIVGTGNISNAHIDVYKRQAIRFLKSARILWRRKNSREILF